MNKTFFEVLRIAYIAMLARAVVFPALGRPAIIDSVDFGKFSGFNPLSAGNRSH